jgi:hypothetical protein
MIRYARIATKAREHGICSIRLVLLSLMLYSFIYFPQDVLDRRAAKMQAMREWQERVNKVVEVCESSAEASAALHCLTGDCLLCLNKLLAATDDGQKGTVQLQCGGCTKPPVLHVSCMIKMQDRGQKWVICRQAFTNVRANPDAEYDSRSDNGTLYFYDIICFSILHSAQHVICVTSVAFQHRLRAYTCCSSSAELTGFCTCCSLCCFDRRSR